MKMSKHQADSLPGWFCNTCDPIINPPHSSKTSTSNTHPLDSPSFDAIIQTLTSRNHPIHRLSGNRSFVNPCKESLDTLQQKHPEAPLTLCYPLPKCYHSTNMLQSSPSTCCKLFLPPWLQGRPRRFETTAFERLHINLCR